MRFNFSVLLASFLASNLIQTVAAAPLSATDLQVRGVNSIEDKSSFDAIHAFSGDVEPADITKRAVPKTSDKLSWSQAVANGEKNIAKLEKPTGHKNYPSFKIHYKESEGLEGKPKGKYKTKDVKINSAYYPKKLLDLLGVKGTDTFTSKSIFSKNQKQTKNGKTEELGLASQAPVGQNGYMPSHGIIFATSNFKAHDLNDEKDQLPASELMMQVWDEVAGSKKDDLKWVVRSHIVNEGTQSIISEALKKLMSQPGFSRIVPRVLVSCISRLNTYPKCSTVFVCFNDHPGPNRSASMGISPPPGSVR